MSQSLLRGGAKSVLQSTAVSDDEDSLGGRTRVKLPLHSSIPQSLCSCTMSEDKETASVGGGDEIEMVAI